jgi:hypothetical protein
MTFADHFVRTYPTLFLHKCNHCNGAGTVICPHCKGYKLRSGARARCSGGCGGGVRARSSGAEAALHRLAAPGSCRRSRTLDFLSPRPRLKHTPPIPPPPPTPPHPLRPSGVGSFRLSEMVGPRRRLAGAPSRDECDHCGAYCPWDDESEWEDK